MIRFGQKCLQCIVAILFLVGYSNADIPAGYLDEVRNKLNYIDWAITANNKIVEAKDDCFFKEEPLTVSKYRESIVNVLGHAIADCVTMKNEFAERKGMERLILFDVNPDTYTPENWNAVIAFNYIDVMINTDLYAWTQNKTKLEIRNEVFSKISKAVVEHYTKKNIKVDDIVGKLRRAVDDITEYDKQLDLMNALSQFSNARKFAKDYAQYKTNWMNKCYISPHIMTVYQITVGTHTRLRDICFAIRQTVKVNAGDIELIINSPEVTMGMSNKIWFSNNFDTAELYDTKTKEGKPTRIGDFIYRAGDLMKRLEGKNDIAKALTRLYKDDFEL